MTTAAGCSDAKSANVNVTAAAQAGTMTASAANGKLKLTGTKIGAGPTLRPRTPGHEVN